MTNIWQLKKQSDPTGVPPATIAKYVVGYLASAEAGKELREMGLGQSDESQETGDASDQAEGQN